MGAMLMPAMIGAGIGAVGGAITGQSPFKTALLGAGLGAGGAGLLGAGGGAGAAASAGGADLAAGTVAPSILGTPTLNASLLTPGAMAGLGSTPSVAGGLGASSLFDKLGTSLPTLSNMDKINLGMKGLDMINQPQQPMQTPPLMPIRPGNPELVSTPLMNVAPNVGLQQGNKIGIPNLATKMPLSEADILRLQQLAQQGIRG
jgi:hypothetical protein